MSDSILSYQEFNEGSTQLMNANKIMPKAYKIALTATILVISSVGYSQVSDNAKSVAMPVSINALMVTLIDHSAHYIWDYGALSEKRSLTDDEWLIVEYYGIQLGAAGPLITLGGSGRLDNTWSASPDWIRYANDLSDAAKTAIASMESKDAATLLRAGDMLVTACEGCHAKFKPDIPTEGFIHNPEYDHLYHLLKSGE